MMVAVAVPSASAPPQHSVWFGHRASSHTVARFSDRTVVCRRSKFSRASLVGVATRSHEGFGGSDRRRLAAASAASRFAPREEGLVDDTTKSEKSGPSSSDCLSEATRRRARGADALRPSTAAPAASSADGPSAVLGACMLENDLAFQSRTHTARSDGETRVVAALTRALSTALRRARIALPSATTFLEAISTNLYTRYHRKNAGSAATDVLGVSATAG